MSDSKKSAMGDFQTPPPLALRVCQFLSARGHRPATVIEPTCGKGHLLAAARSVFGQVALVGFDINSAHLAEATSLLPAARLTRRDFFDVDWREALTGLEGPRLVLGNPPWVTVSKLSRLGISNRPTAGKNPGLKGIDALTGQSNFDISQWMLLELLKALDGREATIALLLKTSVVRKTLERLESAASHVHVEGLWTLDARKDFGVSVNAGLFIVRTGGAQGSYDCPIHEGLAGAPLRTMGVRDGALVADVNAWALAAPLLDKGSGRRWRSGLKHDCARIFELTRRGDHLINGLGEAVDVEPEYLYPLLKSTALAGREVEETDRCVVVPQRRVGEDTSTLEARAPRLFSYLSSHREALSARASRVYRGKPDFSIFGVGDYTFSLWKVAISGLHKRIHFRPVGPIDGRPAVFDDTCYLLPCADEAEARQLAGLLNGARSVWLALVFYDAKRPITRRVLERVCLDSLIRAGAKPAEVRPQGGPLVDTEA